MTRKGIEQLGNRKVRIVQLCNGNEKNRVEMELHREVKFCRKEIICFG